MADDLKKQTISGLVWSTVHRGCGILLGFISSIILARLLTPSDYGCIGMLSIFMTVSTTFIDGGFGAALIQKKDPSPQDYSTIFYWNLLFSVFLYCILFIASPAISNFYHTEILCKVLRIQGIVLVINSARIVQLCQLRKKLQFKIIALVEISVSLFSLLLTIFLAWKGAGVWALVGQQISVSILTTILYWVYGVWRPLRTFSWQSFNELFNFGGFILLSNIINSICNNIQGLLIGRFYSPSTMGYYSKAKSTEELSSTFVSQVIEQVAYPVFSKARTDMEYMKKMLQKFTCVLAFITFPIMLLLILLAKPIFIVLYSEKWLMSVPYFQILCISGVAVCLQGINYSAVAALGRSKSLFRWTLVKRGLGLVMLVLGLMIYGIKGLLAGMVVTSWIIYSINAYLSQKYVGYSLRNQFIDLLPILCLSMFSLVVSYLVGLGFSNEFYLTKAIIQFIAFGISYITLAYLFRVTALNSIREIVGIIRNKEK